MQQTLADAFEISGIGLHLALDVKVKVKPAKVDSGRNFIRVDLENRPVIPALVSSLGQTVLSTELVCQQAQVRTVEHLLAALVGFGIDNAQIEIDGPEIPLLDGSAQIWAKKIEEVGIVAQAATTKEAISIEDPIWVRNGDAFVAALPNEAGTRFSYGIDFPYQVIGNQWESWNGQKETFISSIAPARTFGFADQIEQLKSAGLIKGGNLENALVCNQQQWLNPPLRFENEPVRHKILDLIGDLSLLGKLPRAHIIAYKASHQLHLQLAKEILKTIERT